MPASVKFDIWTSQRREFVISDLIEYLRTFDKTLSDATCAQIVQRLCDKGYDYATLLNSVAPQSGTEKSIVDTDINETSGEIFLYGPNAVYDEFGTGEEGAFNPHPMKNDFPLNPYNSGPFVSSHVDEFGQHYWFYKPMKGHPYFFPNGLTYGIPSGKQMYNTLNYIRNIKDEIVGEEIHNAVEELSDGFKNLR